MPHRWHYRDMLRPYLKGFGGVLALASIQYAELRTANGNTQRYAWIIP